MQDEKRQRKMKETVIYNLLCPLFYFNYVIVTLIFGLNTHKTIEDIPHNMDSQSKTTYYTSLRKKRNIYIDLGYNNALWEYNSRSSSEIMKRNSVIKSGVLRSFIWRHLWMSGTLSLRYLQINLHCKGVMDRHFRFYHLLMDIFIINGIYVAALLIKCRL